MQLTLECRQQQEEKGVRTGGVIWQRGDRQCTESHLKQSLPTQESGLCVWLLFVVQKRKGKKSSVGEEAEAEGWEKEKRKKI